MRRAVARASRPSEADFERQVLELARLLRFRVYHTWLSSHSAAGFPDLVLVKPPHVVFAELKSDTGQLSPAQEAWIDALSRCPGVRAFVWRPSDWDQIVAVLRGSR